MDASSAFLSKFIKNKRDKDKIKQLISNTPNDEICEAIISNKSEHGFNVWVSTLESLLKNEEKLFEIVKEVSDNDKKIFMFMTKAKKNSDLGAPEIESRSPHNQVQFMFKFKMNYYNNFYLF